MRIFRFDETVSIPISRFGSRFSIGPLTSDDGRVRVQIMHLRADGVVGRHRTVLRRLVACVAGSGSVSGDDGAWRAITPGYAALWDGGEEHEARSETGMTLVCIEGEFDVWATAVTKEIVVVDHDPAWAGAFEQLRDRLWPAVADLAVRVDHVGSTAVPGLAAKPVIDLDVVVAEEPAVRSVIERLQPLGYQWRGTLGIEGRHALRFLGADPLPTHHLYVVVDGNQAHRDHLDLRDLLRSDAEASDLYATLKRRSAAEANGDMDDYLARKHDLVTALLARHRSKQSRA